VNAKAAAASCRNLEYAASVFPFLWQSVKRTGVTFESGRRGDLVSMARRNILFQQKITKKAKAVLSVAIR
jgi:hypothetical protein